MMIEEKDLAKFKVPELKQKLLELGYQPKGLKADLIKQLAQVLNAIELQQIQLQQQNQLQQQQAQFEVYEQSSDQPTVITHISNEASYQIENDNNDGYPSSFEMTNAVEAHQEISNREQEDENEEVVNSSSAIADSNSQPIELNPKKQNESLVEQAHHEESFQNSFNDSVDGNALHRENNSNLQEESSVVQEDASLKIKNNSNFQAQPEIQEVSSKKNDKENNKRSINLTIQIKKEPTESTTKVSKVLKKEIIEQPVDDLEGLLKALNMTEAEWQRLNKNHRRKLKKKFRNRIKRKERDEIEKQREKLRDELRRKQQELDLIKQEVIESTCQPVDDDDDRMDIDEEDEPEEEKERKRLEEQQRIQQKQLELQQKLKETIKDKKEDSIEIEYIPEDIPKDSIYLEFLKVFDKFSAVSSDEAKRLQQERMTEAQKIRDHRAKMLELKKPVELEYKDDDDEHEDGIGKISKRKMKQMIRMSVADLKQRVVHPELVEMHDATAKDPLLLMYLKSTRNTVPVPRHWCYKRKYLQGKRGFEKPPFKLPEFIRRTGIQEMREAVAEKEDAKSLKNKMREKIRPKMGKIDIDYQKLHDAFFKWQTKPKMNIHGDLYYEGKEFETRLRDKKPGDLTNELRTALGMPIGPNAPKCPPPWLIAMQRYGPPPSYPSMKIAGLNAPIPEGCCFGYHAGGWGKPPVDEYGRPLYGDVFGLTSNAREALAPEEEVDRTHWGGMESDDEEEEEEESEAEEDDDQEEDSKKNGLDETGLVTPVAEGLATPSGISTGLPSGLETPNLIELRKKRQQIEAEMEGADSQQLYTVVPEKKTDRFGKEMMGSMHVYDFASLSKSANVSLTSKSSSNRVEVTLDPSELESGQIDSYAMAAKYEKTLRESTTTANNPHEDLSDMVAEHVSKQKRHKGKESSSQQSASSSSSGTKSTSSSSKKYQFKF